MSVIGTPMTGLSSYQQMQVWSAKRASAADDYQSNNESLTSALTGSSGSLSSGFTSNDTLSSALFGSVGDALSDEETLMAQVIYARISKEQAAKQDAAIKSLGNLSDLLA